MSPITTYYKWTPNINLSTDLSELQTHKYNYLFDIVNWRYLQIPQIHSLHSPLRFASLSVFSVLENDTTIYPVTQSRHQGITLDTSVSSSPHHSSSTLSPKCISNTSTLSSGANSLVLLPWPLALAQARGVTSLLVSQYQLFLSFN